MGCTSKLGVAALSGQSPLEYSHESSITVNSLYVPQKRVKTYGEKATLPQIKDVPGWHPMSSNFDEEESVQAFARFDSSN